MNQKLKNMLIYFQRNLYTKLFPDFISELEKELNDCKSVLDIGCGGDSPIKYFSRNFYSEAVDIFLPSIEKSKKEKIHNKYHKMNVLDINKKFEANSFDCVIALDLIEHFEKEDALKLIKKMEEIAKKKIIIFTPNGFLPQKEYDRNKWQIHKSGWNVNEMNRLGYKVIGINGVKFLRGDHSKIKFKPKYFWWVISDITQLFVKNNPKKAFQILCVKNKEGIL